jgi:putative (di)nucleoside polyphosphate hydrolase
MGSWVVQIIDTKGFRLNVGIIVSNSDGRLLWARRIGRDVWQFPQGGIRPEENPEEAMFRELYEETGLLPHHVRVVGECREWLCYRLPKRMIRYDQSPLCVGQKQRWFMLQLLGCDEDVRLDSSETPEFDHWRWVNYWHPLKEVAPFKRQVYQRALSEFAPLVASPRCAVRL